MIRIEITGKVKTIRKQSNIYKQGLYKCKPYLINLNLNPMKIKIIDRQIEITDAKIKAIFDNAYKKFNECDVNRNEFDQSALVFLELFLEDNFISNLEGLVNESVSLMKDIAKYKYFEKTPPFKKPIYELNPDEYPQPYELSRSLKKYVEKLGLSPCRDEELINNKLEELRQKDLAKFFNEIENKEG